MMRNKGDRDLKPRKTRSDKGKKRKKGKNYKPFPKTPKGHKTHLKVCIIQHKPMTAEGYRQFSKKTRIHMNKPTMHYIDKATVDVNDIDTKEKVGQLVAGWMGVEGIFRLCGWSHGKTKYRVKQITLAKVTLREIGGNIEPISIELSDSKNISRLPRYWFWKGE